MSTDPNAETALTWETNDPDRLGDLLLAVGCRALPGGVLVMPGLRLELARSAGPDRLRWRSSPTAGPAGLQRGALAGPAGLQRGALAGPAGLRRRSAAAASDGTHVAVRLGAVAIATVDLERAGAAFGGLLQELPDDRLLGARVARTAVPGVLLGEPVSEGRLAATLARVGEGPAALYVAAAPAALDGIQSRLISLGERPRRGEGPFGAQLLAWTRPPWGPHLFLTVEDPANDPPSRSTVGYHRAMTEIEAVPVFRDAESADADWIAGLLSDEGYPAGASDIVRRLERFAEMGSLVRIAERDGERLGFIAVHLVPRFEHDDQLARVIAMVVDPAVRSRGIGRALLAEVDRAAIEAGCAFVEVTAGHHRTDARRLFEAAGFDASVTTYLRKRP